MRIHGVKVKLSRDGAMGRGCWQLRRNPSGRVLGCVRREHRDAAYGYGSGGLVWVGASYGAGGYMRGMREFDSLTETLEYLVAG